MTRMLEVIPITQARKNFLPFVEKVASDFCKFVVTRHGKPLAVVLSYEEYSRMVETLKLFQDEKLMGEMRQGLEQIEQGEIVSLKDSRRNE